MQTYRACLGSMLAAHRGQFVIIHGTTIVGYHHDRADAVRAAFEQFGRTPVLVKQVTDQERIHRLSGAIL